MIVAGLTGSIGMGKSTAAARFRARGIAVFDADALVHALYEGEAAPPIEAAFPGVTRDGRVDRARLSALLMADPDGFERLEAIVHPLVRRAERAFLQGEAARGAKLAVLEIPLLFETGADKAVDAVILVSAASDVQRARVLARPGMTREKFEQLLSLQMPDAKKRTRARFIIDTNGPIAESEAQVDAIIDALAHGEGGAYGRHWA